MRCRKAGTIKIFARLVTTPQMMGRKALNGECICRLTVSDTGEGMDADTLSRALEPFFTTKGVGKGTGLGLSMVHGITEQIGGRLRIESHKGQGTSVELWLPLAHGEVLAPIAEAKVTLADVEKKPLVIVVVDDDKLVLVNTKAMLEDFGHTVIGATSGVAALEMIRKTPRVDLVVTDQAMPQMTGMQLTAAIRVDWPNLPILLMSGYAELPSKMPFEVPKLAKPFSLDDLEDAVVRTMEGKAIMNRFRGRAIVSDGPRLRAAASGSRIGSLGNARRDQVRGLQQRRCNGTGPGLTRVVAALWREQYRSCPGTRTKFDIGWLVSDHGQFFGSKSSSSAARCIKPGLGFRHAQCASGTCGQK